MPDGTWSIESPPGSDTMYEMGGGPNEAPTPNETMINETGAPAGAGTSRDIGERGEPAAGAPRERPSIGTIARNAAITGLKEGALTLVDPIHVNRAFVNDVGTATDSKASTVSRGVAAAGAVLSVIPVLGEARGVLGGFKIVGGGGRGARGLSALLTRVAEAWGTWSANFQRARAMELLYELSNGGAYVTEIPIMAKTPEGVAALKLMLEIIPEIKAGSQGERMYLMEVKFLIQQVLRP